MKKVKYQPKEISLGGETSKYIVYPDGRVINSLTSRELIQWTDNMGYATVVLTHHNKRYRVKIHRLVYEVFKGKLKPHYVINHIDCNKLNNNVDNLEQIPYSANTKHWFKNKEACADYNKQIGQMPGYTITKNDIRTV